MGKNVPEKMNMGMMTKRNREANGLSFFCAAAKAWMGAAKARPVSVATGSSSTARNGSMAPKTAITATKTAAPKVTRSATHTSWPVATCRVSSGDRIMATYVFSQRIPAMTG